MYLRTHKILNDSRSEALNAEVGQVIDAWKYSSFLTPDMASKNDARHGIDCSLVIQPDAISGIVFWRRVWRQKAHVFSCCNHLPNFGIWGFNFVFTLWVPYWTERRVKPISVMNQPNPSLTLSQFLYRWNCHRQKQMLWAMKIDKFYIFWLTQ